MTEQIEQLIYDVSGDWPGNVFLLKGTQAILFDAGMACCGEKMTERVAQILKGQPLDYIFLTHSHYDHISGIPYLRKKWPGVKVCVAPHGKMVMEKESALRVMREMNLAAAKDQGVEVLNYADEDMHADIALTDGQKLILGEWSITAIEAPGHTRDCLSYLIQHTDYKERILLCCETAGVYLDHIGFIPGFLVSFRQSIQSVKKMQQVGAEILLLSHYGFLKDKTPDEMWDRCLTDLYLAKERIKAEIDSGHDLEQQLENLAAYYWTEECRPYQPHRAYATNMKCMLETIKREYV